jgi:hypothetical protein
VVGLGVVGFEVVGFGVVDLGVASFGVVDLGEGALEAFSLGGFKMFRSRYSSIPPANACLRGKNFPVSIVYSLKCRSLFRSIAFLPVIGASSTSQILTCIT